MIIVSIHEVTVPVPIHSRCTDLLQTGELPVLPRKVVQESNLIFEFPKGRTPLAYTKGFVRGWSDPHPQPLGFNVGLDLKESCAGCGKGVRDSDEIIC